MWSPSNFSQAFHIHTHSPGVLLAPVTPYEAHMFISIQNLIINLVTLIIVFISQILSVLSHVSILNLETLATIQLPYLPFVPLVLSQGPTISSIKYMCMLSHSVMSDSLWPYELQPARLLCPQDSPLRGRILKWIAMPSSREPSWPGYQAHVSWASCIRRQILYHWAKRKAPVKDIRRQTLNTTYVC